MAEVIGIVAGIMGVADVGSRLTRRLQTVARTWKAAPLEVIALENEVSDLSVVLRYTHDTCESLRTSGCNIELVQDLGVRVAAARQILSEIEVKLGQLSSLKERKLRISWIQSRQFMAGKATELQTIRKQIKELLQSHHVLNSTRVQLQLEKICLNLRNSHESTTVNMECIDTRLSFIESQLLLLRDSGQPTPRSTEEKEVSVNSPKGLVKGRESGSEGGHTDDFYRPILSVWAQYRNRTCPEFCLCRCHSSNQQTRGLWKTPIQLRAALGACFASYTGYPVWKQPCDVLMCHRRGSKTWEVLYEFPLWLLKWHVHALAHLGLDQGPSLNLTFRQRIPYLPGNIFQTIDSGNVDLLAAIIRKSPDSINVRSYKAGFTPLHLACMRSNKIPFEIFKMILQAGADFNAESDDGKSVGNVVVFQKLIGILPPRFEAEISKWISLSELISDMDLSPVSQIILGLRGGSIKTLLRQVPASVLCVNKLDELGSTPLFWAVKMGNVDAVSSLVEAGVDVNQPSRSRRSPIMGALAHPDQSCFQWLLKNGGDVYKQDRDGNNTFTTACFAGKLEAVKYMVDHGVDPGTRDGKLRTGIAAATAFDKDEIVAYLLDMGVDSLLPTNWGDVPVLLAVRSNAHRSLRTLLGRKGIPHQFTNPHGWTVLHYAALAADLETINILCEYELSGVDVDAIDRREKATAEELLMSRRGAEENADALFATFRKLLGAVKKSSGRSD